MKALLIVLDGVADRSQGALGGKTPLQAAETPNLDRLAGAGACGHMYPLTPGACPSSDQAHWRILGYGGVPYPGRATLEALGAGVTLADGDVAISVNMATTVLDGNERYVQAAPAYLPEEEATRVAASLAEYEPEFFDTRLHHLGGPFMLLVLSGGASPLITDSDPLFYRLPVNPIVGFEGAPEAAGKTASEISRFSSWAAELFESHPVNVTRAGEAMTVVNYMLSKWPGVHGDLPSFESRWGFKAVASTSGLLYAGLAKAMGMELLQSAAQDVEEDLRQKLEAAHQALGGGFDFAFVHTKAADEASHTGRPRRKVRAIEELDRALETAASYAREADLVTVITADHATPSGGAGEVIHSGESVPVVIAGRNARVDAVESFDEVSCAVGSLGLISGADIMPLVLNFTDRARFGTSRPRARDIPYRPDPS
ncbi:MAG: alkaline phosphatase [Actinobacteria bacterium]|nr:alkaline phosphatase [Actinomycetota bacterium]